MNSQREQERAIEKIATSISADRLIVVVGTGVSIGLTANAVPTLSWRGLIEDGFRHAEARGIITAGQYAAWKPQVSSNDLDEMIGAAEFVSRKLKATSGNIYDRWIDGAFGDTRPSDGALAEALKRLKATGAQFCTLNYDTLLEQVFGCGSLDMTDIRDVSRWVRREDSGILHLHGVWKKPETCVLGVRDYEATLEDGVRDLVQRSISSFNHLLFIGCGGTFEDPNFSSLIAWLRGNLKGATPEHFALVRDSEVDGKRADPAWHGYVDPIGFGDDYPELPAFLELLAGQKRRSEKGGTAPPVAGDNHEVILDCYRQFLLKDCGHMTIEGMNADLQTAQKRFDLEQLFVPLELSPPQPEFLEDDPDREDKIIKWIEENKEPRPFGAEFLKHKRLALLALPGGGKTLLLKRLAVAYADATRRTRSNDELPDLDLLPIIIKCREWRDHIKDPIITIIGKIPSITGQRNLMGLVEAISGRLSTGNVLLLIDGLDEIHSDADRSTFVENLEYFISDFPEIRVVLTSREAGFNLVAPSVIRFCERFKVAPLNQTAIKLLCHHWHNLMSGGTMEGEQEAEKLAEILVSSPSLLRLAENPLLLTMLLVVKHGAGRLPPDRVSLYDRAVEVLLDTWNIKGHEPLNPREAVPQLACIAFELMKQGKQTATQKELLNILERARDQLPQIRRYATDAPDAFLKRVELRSSLLVEAGHQMEGIKLVPFYQFRHLTFQEYLAAVAATDGHHLNYTNGETVLDPLKDYINLEEWKEVIPMAAVLAQKRAEPLLAAIVGEVDKLADAIASSEDFPGRADWEGRGKLPSPVSLLTQSLIEEAEPSPKTLASAIHHIATFGKGCRSNENWEALSRGPYGAELLQHCWELYENMDWPRETWLRNTLASLASLRKPFSYWESKQGQKELTENILSVNPRDAAISLLTCCGIHWTAVINHRRSAGITFGKDLIEAIRSRMFDDIPCVSHAGTWAFGLCKRHDPTIIIDTELLDKVLSRWVNGSSSADAMNLTSFILTACVPHDRSAWSPRLDEVGEALVKRTLNSNDNDPISSSRTAGLIVAYFARNIVDDWKLRKVLFPKGRRSLHTVPDFIVQELDGLGAQPGKATRRSGKKLGK